MNREATGTYRITATGGEQVRAFVPLPLPPAPPLEITGPRQLLLERATLAVGRLDSISTLLPDAHLFLCYRPGNLNEHSKSKPLKIQAHPLSGTSFHHRGATESTDRSITTFAD